MIETIKEGSEKLLEAITTLFNKCLRETQTSTAWNNTVIIIIHKKGNRGPKELQTSQLTSHLYKLFIKILTKRLTPKLNFYQLIEQTGFREGYRTSDHLQNIKILIEKY